jgi:hypothetical protein
MCPRSTSRQQDTRLGTRSPSAGKQPLILNVYLDTPAEIDRTHLIENKQNRSLYLDTHFQALPNRKAYDPIRIGVLSGAARCERASSTRQSNPSRALCNLMKINKSGTPDPAEKMRSCACANRRTRLGSQQKVPARIAALSERFHTRLGRRRDPERVALGGLTALRGIADETFRLLDTHCRVIHAVSQ